MNNAGVGQTIAPIVALSDQEWDRVLRATLTGAFYCCRAAGRFMEQQEGYKGVQLPGWDGRVIDLDTAAASKTYCDEYKGNLQEMGLEITELTGYLAGQVLAVHPAYELMFEAFHPPGLRGEARTAWATGELKKCIQASVHLGTTVIPVL